MSWLLVVRVARVVGWIAYGAAALMACQDLRYGLMHQDTSFQQSVLTGTAISGLLCILILAVGTDRVLTLAERTLETRAARQG